MKIGCTCINRRYLRCWLSRHWHVFRGVLHHREHKARTWVVSNSFPTPLMVHQKGEPSSKVSNESHPPGSPFFVFMASFLPSFLRENFSQNPQHLRSESVSAEAPRWGNPRLCEKVGEIGISTAIYLKISRTVFYKGNMMKTPHFKKTWLWY